MGLYLGSIEIGGSSGGGGGGLNAGELFTTSGTWTVPAGVTYAHVTVRGGNGADVNWNSAAPVTLNGASGGTSTALGVSASGGGGGYLRCSNPFSFHRTARDGITVSAIVAVTPGASETITIGSGLGSHVSIMWSAL